MAKISVIIPLYNKEKYIGRALSSVLGQSYGDFEVIVIDDGSTDAGAEVVLGFCDERVRLIRQENAGPGAARNRGIAESKADLLAFLDADDEWMPDFLEKSLRHLESSDGCELTACSYYLGPEKRDVTELCSEKGLREGPWQVGADTKLEDVLGSYFLFNSWAIVCNKEVALRYGGFYEAGGCNYGEDTFLWVQVLFNHKVYRILEPLVWYHEEESQLGPGREGLRPLFKFLEEPEKLRENCRESNRELLEEFLSHWALLTAHNCASRDDGYRHHADELIKSFPLMRNRRWEYLKLRLKMACPWLVGPMRKIKSCMRATMKDRIGAVRT